MSSSVSATYGLELQARRWQTAVAVAAVCACGAVPWCLSTVAPLEQLASSVLAVLTVSAGLARADWLPLFTQPVRIVHAATGWRIKDGTGRAVHTRLHPRTRFFRHFVWLRFESRHSLLLGPGDLNPDAFRRLQVLLRRAARSSLHELGA